MAYIGKTPASAALTSGDISDGIITSAKIANGGVETVDIADANVTAAKLASGTVQNQSAFKNIIINGDMSVAQRATSVTGITGAGYNTIDRYRLGGSVPGTWTQSQATDVPTGQGFAKSLKMDCTTSASQSSGDTMYIQSKYEGQNLQYLKKGTSSAESTTLSFWVKTNKTGTYIATLKDNDNNRTISKAYTVSSANTWEKKTLTFAGDTSGALGNDNGASLELWFWLSAGSDNSSGTLNTSWNSVTNANNAVGQVNLADSTSNEWYVTGIQLEAGTSASDFEYLPVDVNLQRCQRYFYMHGEGNGAELGIGGYYNSSQIFLDFQFPVSMRTSPSLYQVSGTNFFLALRNGASDFLDDFAIGNVTVNIFSFYNNSDVSGTGGDAAFFRCSNSSAKIGADAEIWLIQ